MPGMSEREPTDVTGGSFCWWCSDGQCGWANWSHDYVENYSLSITWHSFGILHQSNKYGCNTSSNDAYSTVYKQDYLNKLQLLHIYFYSKTNQMHNISQIYEYFILEQHSTCFERSLHPSSGVWDRTYGIRYISYRFCGCLLVGTKWNWCSISFLLASNHRTCMTYTWCCMYSLRHLTIDRETVRNR